MILFFFSLKITYTNYRRRGDSMVKIRASKCEVRSVEKTEEKNFLNENHRQGFCGSEICYGLYYTSELIELMSFGKPRFQRKQEYRWELIRLCTKQGYQVYGGASKLLKHFQANNEESTSLCSFCDLDHFDGNVYSALGFKLKNVAKGYHYVKDGVTYNRQQFMRKGLAKKFGKPEYEDYSKYTEREIMELEGYTRVDDVKGQGFYVLSDCSKYYTYRLVFEDGATYIGSHVQNAEDDDYVTSSTYAKDHTVVSRKIISYYNSREEMYSAETHQILLDKVVSDNNVNFNGGGEWHRTVYTSLDNVHYSTGKTHSEAVREGIKRNNAVEHCKQTKIANGTYGKCWNKGLTGLPSSGISKAVEIDGIQYDSICKAATALGISRLETEYRAGLKSRPVNVHERSVETQKKTANLKKQKRHQLYEDYKKQNPEITWNTWQKTIFSEWVKEQKKLGNEKWWKA